MDRKTFIDKIKTLFSEVENNVEEKEVEVNFVEVTTIDGLVLKTDAEDFVEGAQVLVVGEDGTEAPATEGEYTVEGKIIVIDAESKVVEVKEVGEEEPTEEEPTAEPAEEEVDMASKEKEAIEKRFEALEKSISNLSESLSAIDNLSEVVSKIAGLPAEEEVKLSKQTGNKEEKFSSREEKLKMFSKRKK